jgi:hypothetical protein
VPRRDLGVPSVLVHLSNRASSTVGSSGFVSKRFALPQPPSTREWERPLRPILRSTHRGRFVKSVPDLCRVECALLYSSRLPAAPETRGEIVDARRMGRDEGERDDSTWMAHLDAPWYAR